MKKVYIPYIVFCMLLTTLFVVNIFDNKKQTTYSEDEKIMETKKKVVNDSKSKAKLDSENEFYTVKAMENNIYLYDKNNNILDKLNINYNNLREYDKNQFELGIEISDMSGVYQLIEDFSN